MSHTPGPWVMEYEPEIDIDEVRQDGQQVSAAGGYSGEDYFTGRILEAETGEAIADWVSEGNARLIAAAPELLEVIREAVDSAEREMTKGRKASPGLATWLEKARAALAKARADEGKENA